MKLKRTLLSFILVITMLLSVFPFISLSASAETEPTQTEELEVLQVKDWILDVMFNDYYAFEIVFNGDVLPFSTGEEFRMLDGDATQTVYMEYFKFCGKTFAEINQEITEEDMDGWLIASFPATNGGVFLEPIIVYAHKQSQLQVRIHKEYVASISGDITIEVVEGSVITDKEGTSYTAGAGLLWKLTDEVRTNTVGSWYTEKPEAPAVRDVTVGISTVFDIKKDAEYYTIDINFSRDIFRSKTMHTLDYSAIDGTHGNYSYLKDYFTINNVTIADINSNTDDSGYTYTTYHTQGFVDALRVPVLMISVQTNQMKILIHEQYYQDNLSSNLVVGIKQDFYIISPAPNQEETAYERVGFKLAGAVTFTANADNSFTSSVEYVNYVADKEIIERAYTSEEMNALTYEKINLHSISTIVTMGDVRYYNGEKRTQAQYVVMYFDKPVCYQYIPYASGGKLNLSNNALNPAGTGVYLTQDQIDAYYDYHMDEYLNNFIKLDGKTLAEIKASETDPSAVPDLVVRFHYAGASSLPSSIVFYIEYNSNAWMRAEEEHTIEILKGFRTPLLGEVKENKKFVYNPESAEWATVSAGSQFSDTELVDVISDGGCNGSFGGGLVICAVALAGATAITLIKRRKNNEEN